MLVPSPSPPVVSSPPPAVASLPQEEPDHAADMEEKNHQIPYSANFRGSKFLQIAIFEDFVEIIS